MILAEATPTADSLKSFLEVVFYLAGLVAAIAVAWKHLTGKSGETRIANDPLKVEEAITFATKPELTAVETRINGEVHQLHGRISSVRNELTGKVDGLDARIDQIPQRTIELLKTIKEYHKP